MLSWLRRQRSFTAAIALAIGVVASSTCLTVASQTPEQRACCAAMAHHCGEIAIKADCCDRGTQSRDSVAASLAAGALSAPVPVLAAVLEMPPVATLGDFVTGSTALVKPPGTPTYVLDSVFRI
jgi:hypothetical protein